MATRRNAVAGHWPLDATRSHPKIKTWLAALAHALPPDRQLPADTRQRFVTPSTDTAIPLETSPALPTYRRTGHGFPGQHAPHAKANRMNQQQQRSMFRAMARRAACALAWVFAAMAPAQAAVVVSQLYGGGGNSGATLQHDYIELFNNGDAAVAIGGWSVQYASATGTSWQTTAIPAGATLQAGQYYLIREAVGAGGTTPVTGDVAGTIAMSATAGKVALANVATPLAGAAPSSGTVVDIVSFGPSATPTRGSPAPAPSNTTAILRGAGGCADTASNGADFTTGVPLPRSSASALAPCGTPGGGGIGGGGGGGTPPVAAAIFTIQGSGAASPLAGRTVVTSGVVTKVLATGFFLQDIAGDGDPATSDGIYVFTATAPPAAAAVGNLVQVTGTVSEFNTGSGTLTELANIAGVASLGSGYTLAPATVSLPLAAGDSLERFEGMLVRIAGTLTVQQNFFLPRFGELTIGVGRHETPTNRYRPGSADAIALADLQARSRLLLDDGNSAQNPNPTPYDLGNGGPRAGDTVSNLVGVLDYGPATATAGGAGLYRLQPTAAPTFAVANPRAAAPPAVGGANVRLASMNVLNFFTTFTDGRTADGRSGQGCSLGTTVSASNCRGADNLAEFQRQRQKIVLALAGLDADAVGLMEMQNNGNTAVQSLVDALNARVGAGTYATVAVPPQGTGTDAIRVAMVYKPARLQAVGDPVADPSAVNNRPTLAQTFAAANGERLTLVVNHLKSKSGCPGSGDADAAGNLDAGDGQGCWNAVRIAQAKQLRNFIGRLQSDVGSSDVLLVGDFNAYAREDPIDELTANGLVDVSGRFESFGYSYVFDGTAGRLDHAITSASLAAKVTGAVHWHIDADESVAQDYNVEFKQPDCAACEPDPFDASVPYRASDHDPVLVGVALFKSVAGTAGRDTLVGTDGDDVIQGGVGADVLTGRGGVNVYVYTSMRDAGDTITDFVPAKDVLDLRTLLRSVGYTGSDPVADGWVRFVAVGADTSVQVAPAAGAAPRALLTLAGVAPARLLPARDLIVR